MEKINKILIMLVVGSLLLNIYTIYSLHKIELKVQNVSNDSLGYDLSRLNSMINQIVEENKWIVSEEFKPIQEISTPEEIHLNIEWTFKEIEESAMVSVLHRAKSEVEWKEVAAQNKGTNTFIAPIVLTPSKKYEYQIIAKGNTLRIGDIGEIPLEFYRLKPMIPFNSPEVSIDGDIVNVKQQFIPQLYDFYIPQKATAKVLHDTTADEIQLRLINRETSYDIEFELKKVDLKTGFYTIEFELEFMDGVIIESGYWDGGYWTAEDLTKFAIIIFDDFNTFEFRHGGLY